MIDCGSEADKLLGLVRAVREADPDFILIDRRGHLPLPLPGQARRGQRRR